MIEIIAVFALLPINLWIERNQRFRSFDPLEQNLQRASHGVALLALMALALAGMYSGRDVAGFLGQLVRDPAGNLAGLAIIGIFALVCIPRVVVGTRRCWGMRDGLRSTRAAIKIGVGILGYFYLWSDGFLRLASPYFMGGNGLWFAIGWTLLKAAAIWCIVTGIVRLLILTLSGFGSGAQRRVAGHIRDQQVMFRPVTRPPWWRPW